MNNISKIVISKDNAKKVGYVLDVVLDFENFNILGYIVVEEETENEFFVAVKDVTFSENAGFIQDAGVLQFLGEKFESLLGKQVFSRTGIDLGIVSALKFNKKHCTVLVTDKCEVKTNLIGKVGDVILLGKQISYKKPAFPKVDYQAEVKILTAPKLPEKVSLSTNYYLGKVCLQDVMGYNNERLVSKGDTINKALLDKVKKHNKLNELFFALKK